MVVDAVLLLVGFALLIGGADALVRAAGWLGRAFGLSPLVIGLTVVAFGTSTPELVVSLSGALRGAPDLALGNVVGSNILNVLLILGLSATLTPLVVETRLVRCDVPLLIGVSVAVAVFAADGRIGWPEGLLLTAGLVTWTTLTMRAARRAPPTVPTVPTASREPPRTLRALGVALGGLVALVAGAHLAVSGATGLARAAGVSELVIGLTVVAAGTSLPEVAASVIAALRGQGDLAVGNVVGSNLFNLFAVLGISALASPGGLVVAPAARSFDIPFMVAAAVACLPIIFTGHRVSRAEGVLLLLWLAAYLVLLGLRATEHAGEVVATRVLLGLALPLTLVGLGFGVAQSLRERARAHRG